MLAFVQDCVVHAAVSARLLSLPGAPCHAGPDNYGLWYVISSKVYQVRNFISVFPGFVCVIAWCRKSAEFARPYASQPLGPSNYPPHFVQEAPRGPPWSLRDQPKYLPDPPKIPIGSISWPGTS